MKLRLLAVATTLLAGAAVPAMAQEHGARPAGRAVTMTGTVVDVSCLVGSGARGEGRVDRAGGRAVT